MLDANQALATVFILTVFVVPLAAVFRKRGRATSKEGHSLPPGPPASWFWSNVMPTVNIGSTFVGWANEYGPVIAVRQGSKVAIVVARVEAATEIMEKEGSALADRPSMIAAGELLSGGKRIALTGNGELFRRLRKAIHTHFQPKAVETYKDIQLEHAKTFVLNILSDSENYRKHIHQYSVSIMLRIAYGKSGLASTEHPDFVGLQQIVVHFIEGMRPGGYLVDRFPWLKYIPGYGRRLKRYHDSDLRFYRDQLSRVEDAMSSPDDAGPSFARTLLENVHEHQLSFDQMCFLAGTVFEAGSDTTANAIIVMIMAAACFPEAQRRVHEELDTVVGMDRLPSWNDWNALPQLHAFISEGLRWRPVTPIGFGHRSTRDIIWRGYYIPAGTTVTGNQWAISRDPVAFPDPDTFNPQRWLDSEGRPRDDLDCYPFGFGRRVCPGKHFANRSMYVALALLFWSFRIVARPDAPIDTTPDEDNIVAHMAHFEVDFVPRVQEARLREAMGA